MTAHRDAAHMRGEVEAEALIPEQLCGSAVMRARPSAAVTTHNFNERTEISFAVFGSKPGGLDDFHEKPRRARKLRETGCASGVFVEMDFDEPGNWSASVQV